MTALPRREQLLALATDDTLEHGLLDLSLRPLAARLGTSDRMLLYHFGTKDALVAGILRSANDRSVDHVMTLPPYEDVRAAVLGLWEVVSHGEPERCARLYVEAAALGLLGAEPYLTVVGEANGRWTNALSALLRRSGCSEENAPRAVALLDAALMGLHLDLPLERGTPTMAQTVRDVADALAALARD